MRCSSLGLLRADEAAVSKHHYLSRNGTPIRMVLYIYWHTVHICQLALYLISPGRVRY